MSNTYIILNLLIFLISVYGCPLFISIYFINKKPLFGFVGDEHEQKSQGIPFSLLDYLELVDWSGRIIREDKRGAVSSHHPRLLSKLGLDSET